MNRHDTLELIVRQAHRGDLNFPTHMSASIRLQQTLGDPDCHLDKVAELVIAEPLVAARLVAIANSVAFTRFGGKISNVRAAVTQLGLKTLRSVVAAVFLRQVGTAIANPAIRLRAESLWQHCAEVAALARVLARELSAVDPETALFAGVVHEIGSFYLLARAEEFPVLVEPCGTDEDVAALGQVSAAILHALKVPKTVVEAVSPLPVVDSFDSALTLGQVVTLANDFAEIRSPLESPFQPSTLSFGNGIQIRCKDVASLLQVAAVEIAATRDALLA